MQNLGGVGGLVVQRVDGRCINSMWIGKQKYRKNLKLNETEVEDDCLLGCLRRRPPSYTRPVRT